MSFDPFRKMLVPKTPAAWRGVTSRRAFLKQSGMMLGATTWMTAAPWPVRAFGQRDMHLAVLADSHVMPADHNPLYEQRLKDAVAQINAMPEQADAVLYAGGLAHMGCTQALARGHAILKGLRAPVVAVPGAHDWHGDDGAAWQSHFGHPNTSQTVGEIRIIGMHSTHLRFADEKLNCRSKKMPRLATIDDPRVPRFEVGEKTLHWLSTQLASESSDRPIVILSATPLYNYYAPWNFYSRDAQAIASLTQRFKHLTFVHGHTQHAVDANPNKTLHLGAPSTAWSWPYPPTSRSHRRPNARLPFGRGVMTVSWLQHKRWKATYQMAGSM